MQAVSGSSTVVTNPLNVTATNVPLYSTAFPTNAWRLGGLDYTFPTNASLDAPPSVKNRFSHFRFAFPKAAMSVQPTSAKCTF